MSSLKETETEQQCFERTKLDFETKTYNLQIQKKKIIFLDDHLPPIPFSIKKKLNKNNKPRAKIVKKKGI
jgi:hypothetical protein